MVEGDTLLHVAMRIVKELVRQRGEDLESIHNGGMLDVVGVLLAFGADPTVRNSKGHAASDIDSELWSRLAQQAQIWG